MKTIIRKLLYIGILTFLFIAFKTTNVQAASSSLTATTTEPTEGQSVTVTANVTAGAWNLQFSGAGKSETIYGYTQSNSNSSDSKSITFTAGSAGTTYTFTLTGDMTDISATNSETVNKSITITVKAKETVPIQPAEPGTTTKSSEARLSNLGITPNDFKGFKRDTTTYNVEVPNSVSKVKVYATAVDSKATISGTGNVTLKEGQNTVNVVVTAEDGTKKTYTLNITRKVVADETDELENGTSEARLSNLGIRPKEYDFSGFKKDTTSYSVEVPNELEEVEIYAETVSSKAKVTGTGKVTLKEGKNTFEIVVTAEDGTKKTYTLEITRKEIATTEEPDEQPEETTKEVLGLTSLLIKDLNISPKFNTKTYEYTVGLTEDLSELEIEAKANNSDAIIEIIGNENLQQGENIITILVSNAETEEVATYQIIVNKNVNQSEAEAKVEWLKPSTWGLKEKIIVAVVAVLILIIIVAVVIKIRLAKNNEEDLDLPGAEELDKALAEHQELAEDTEPYQTYEDENRDEQINEEESDAKSDIEKAQEYFETYSKRKGKHHF